MDLCHPCHLTLWQLFGLSVLIGIGCGIGEGLYDIAKKIARLYL